MAARGAAPGALQGGQGARRFAGLPVRERWGRATGWTLFGARLCTALNCGACICQNPPLSTTPPGPVCCSGPRIRMGVHWAVEGTVVQRLHQITKHRVFTGPAFQVGGWMIARSLCHRGCWACAVVARCCIVACSQTPPASLLSLPRVLLPAGDARAVRGGARRSGAAKPRGLGAPTPGKWRGGVVG